MPLQNTAYAYGQVAKCFHWGSAAMIVAAYGSVYYRDWFAASDTEHWVAIQLHFSLGLSILSIVVLRIAWRLLDHRPEPAEGAPAQHLAARLGHFSLYLLMLLMPLTGYLSIANYLASGGGSIRFLLLYDLTWLVGVQLPEALGITLEQLEGVAGAMHHILGAWVFWVLILGHVLAALHHHLIRKDDTLRRMTISRQPTRGTQYD